LAQLVAVVELAEQGPEAQVRVPLQVEQAQMEQAQAAAGALRLLIQAR
jgi:hypothetical protein